MQEYENITLEGVIDYLKQHGSASCPLEHILLQLATGEMDINEIRISILRGNQILN